MQDRRFSSTYNRPCPVISCVLQSAPGSDAFLTLAYRAPLPNTAAAPQPALSCFIVPRWLPDGSRNAGFRVMRLKDKVGDRSNASSEVEYDNAVGFLLVSSAAYH